MKSINSTAYVDQILEAHYKPWCRALEVQGYRPIFMQDDAPIHTPAEVRLWLRMNKIEVMNWPPFSPDLNPDEYFWNRMKQKIGAYPQLIFASGPMFEAAHKEWHALGDRQEQLKWVATIWDRCRAATKVRGRSTKY